MTEVNPPGWLQTGSHTALQHRLYLQGWLSHRTDGAGPTGTVPDPKYGGMVVSPSSLMNVSISAGIAFVQGTEAAVQGYYACYNNAAVVLSVTAADPTLNRIDLIIARVRDAEFSGVTSAWALEVVTGTAAASPTAPATPVNSAVLAQINVTAGLTTIASGNIVSTRPLVHRTTTALGGFEVVDNKATYDAVGAPLWVYETSTDTFNYQTQAAVWRNFWTSANAAPGIIYGKIYETDLTLATLTNATETAIAQLNIASVPVTGRYMGTLHINGVTSNKAGDEVTIQVRRTSLAGTIVAVQQIRINLASTWYPVHMNYIDNLTSAPDGYFVTAQRSSGTGTVTVGNSAQTGVSQFNLLQPMLTTNLVIG